MKNKVVLALSFTTLALALNAQPGHAQVDIGLGFDGGSVGIGGIPGISASPYAADSIVPTVVGGGNTSVVQNVNGFTSPAVQGQPALTPSGSRASAPGQPTNQQAISIANTTSPSLNQTSMNLMAPNSVDTSPFPSGQWSYGFPNESSGPFMGVSKGSVGGFIPQTSTASVDINTYDGPLVDPFSNSAALGIGPNINFSVPLGGLTLNGSLNANQAIDSVQNFFGQ